MKLSEAIRILRDAGIEDAPSEARTVFSALGGIPTASLYGADPATDAPLVARAIDRRAAREPLAYILGEIGFYREVYAVTPAVLIPREDTELLVDHAVQALNDGAHFLDLCTGSGCIALSVLNNTAATSAVAVDLYDDALTVARGNAARLGLSDRVRFVRADVRQTCVRGPFDAILSNPPYVADAVYETLQREIFFEPRPAFVGGEDGMDFYRAILDGYKNELKPNGFFGFEIGYDQGDAIARLARRYGFRCRLMRDLSGHDRLAILEKE